MLIMTMSAFVFLTVPFYIYLCIEPQMFQHSTLYCSLYVLASLNSTVNFPLYCIGAPTFRAQFLSLIRDFRIKCTLHTPTVPPPVDNIMNHLPCGSRSARNQCTTNTSTNDCPRTIPSLRAEPVLELVSVSTIDED